MHSGLDQAIQHIEVPPFGHQRLLRARIGGAFARGRRWVNQLYKGWTCSGGCAVAVLRTLDGLAYGVFRYPKL